MVSWLARAAGVALAALLLAGCLVVSGEATTIDSQGQSGNVSTAFVSAEGSEERRLRVAEGPGPVQLIAIVALEAGDLQLELVDASGAVAFVVAGRPNAQVTRSGAVQADEAGEVRYRVTARGARNGSFQIFFQP